MGSKQVSIIVILLASSVIKNVHCSHVSNEAALLSLHGRFSEEEFDGLRPRLTHPLLFPLFMAHKNDKERSLLIKKLTLCYKRIDRHLQKIEEMSVRPLEPSTVNQWMIEAGNQLEILVEHLKQILFHIKKSQQSFSAREIQQIESGVTEIEAIYHDIMRRSHEPVENAERFRAHLANILKMEGSVDNDAQINQYQNLIARIREFTSRSTIMLKALKQLDVTVAQNPGQYNALAAAQMTEIRCQLIIMEKLTRTARAIVEKLGIDQTQITQLEKALDHIQKLLSYIEQPEEQKENVQEQRADQQATPHPFQIPEFNVTQSPEADLPPTQIVIPDPHHPGLYIVSNETSYELILSQSQRKNRRIFCILTAFCLPCFLIVAFITVCIYALKTR